MSDFSVPDSEVSGAPISPEEAAATAFEQRVLTRDEAKPAVVRFDRASVLERLRPALRQYLGQDDSRRLRKLAVLCHGFIAQPSQHSTDPALVAELNCSASALAESWGELRAGGLVERYHDGTHRRYRLTRAGEDWLLAVVKGE
jgi:DNA-binding transcriptional ArsR family regulator